jgi:hypothetical protein
VALEETYACRQARFHGEFYSGLGGRSAGIDDLEGLAYTRMILAERE